MPRRADRLPKILAVVTTAVFYVALAGIAFVLLFLPIMKLAGDRDQEWSWGLPISAVALDTETRVATSWEGTVLRIDDAQGSLRLPLGPLPWGLFALLWLHTAVAGGLLLGFLHHLRQLFRSVREGSPFDTANAKRLRWLGLILLAIAVLNKIGEVAASLAVRDAVVGDDVRILVRLDFDIEVIFVALVLLALAEIFRRGTELEDERALVI